MKTWHAFFRSRSRKPGLITRNNLAAFHRPAAWDTWDGTNMGRSSMEAFWSVMLLATWFTAMCWNSKGQSSAQRAASTEQRVSSLQAAITRFGLWAGIGSGWRAVPVGHAARCYRAPGLHPREHSLENRFARGRRSRPDLQTQAEKCTIRFYQSQLRLRFPHLSRIFRTLFNGGEPLPKDSLSNVNLKDAIPSLKSSSPLALTL